MNQSCTRSTRHRLMAVGKEGITGHWIKGNSIVLVMGQICHTSPNIVLRNTIKKVGQVEQSVCVSLEPQPVGKMDQIQS